MKTLLTLLLTLFFVTSANAGMKSSYELKQPLEIIIMRLSIPGADKILTRKNGGELISKELTGVDFIISDGFSFSMTYDKVVKREDRLLKFKEVVLSKGDSVVTMTKLVSKDSVVDKYILVTTFKRSSKDTTLVEHELVYHKNGKSTGFGVMITQRIVLVKLQKGIRQVVGEVKDAR